MMKTHEMRRPVKIEVIERKASLPIRTAAPQEDRFMARIYNLLRKPIWKEKADTSYNSHCG
jgi:hypothetical protein